MRFEDAGRFAPSFPFDVIDPLTRLAVCAATNRMDAPHPNRRATGACNRAYKHGLHTAEAVAERRAVAELIRRARAGVSQGCSMLSTDTPLG
jgi:hypothetical protein